MVMQIAFEIPGHQVFMLFQRNFKMNGSGGFYGKNFGSSNYSSSSLTRRKSMDIGGIDNLGRRSTSSSRYMGAAGEHTVKRLRLSRALTVPETTSIFEACHRMVSRKADALLLTDSNALLCGILTDKDIATRVIARELNLQDTPVSKVMTRNPAFVLSNTPAVEALQKMVQGKFRHLPVVENGKVIALVDIAKCLYDAIARMERVAEKGKAIAAAVEGVEKQWGTSASGPNTFIETIRERMFKPSLSTIVDENSKVVTVSRTDTVLTATKKMLDCKLNSAIVTVDNNPCGILTSKDILMRVIGQNLPPESTYAETVMTPDPEGASIDTPIVVALQKMHDGKFLHLPVIDRDGSVVTVLDVIHITHAAVATVENSGVGNEPASAIMQNFWDSTMASGPLEDEDSRSEGSMKLTSEETDPDSRYSGFNLPNSFGFKLEDKKGLLHRFTSDTRSLTDLTTCILQRVGDDIDLNHLPQILYEDEDRDKVIIASDSDLTTAVEHAKEVGLKGLRLHLDYSESSMGRSQSMEFANRNAWAGAYSAVAAGTAVVASIGIFAFLKRYNS